MVVPWEAEKGSFRNSCNLERYGLEMSSFRSVYNRGWRVELECALLVDGDAAENEVMSLCLQSAGI